MKEQCGMRNAECGLKTGILALLVVATGAGSLRGEIVLEEMRDQVIARAVIDRESVDLSGKLSLVLTVEGPGRVEVAPPRPLLTEDSAQAWHVRELNVYPVELLTGNRSRWTQEFQLSPFEEGKKIAIELMPLKVKAGNSVEIPITWTKRAEIEVKLTIGMDRTLLPITDIEKLPPAPPLFTPRPKPAMLVGLAISIVLIVGALGMIVLRRKKPDAPPLVGSTRALNDLGLLRKSAGGTTTDFARVAEVLRIYMEEQFQIAAGRLTTAEVLVAVRKQGPTLEPFANSFQEILDRCDLAKFAGSETDSNDWPAYADRAIVLVEQTSNRAGSSQTEF